MRRKPSNVPYDDAYRLAIALWNTTSANLTPPENRISFRELNAVDREKVVRAARKLYVMFDYEGEPRWTNRNER